MSASDNSAAPWSATRSSRWSRASVPEKPPTIACRPSGVRASVIAKSTPSNGVTGFPVRQSQARTPYWAALAENTQRPSGVKVAAVASAECSSGGETSRRAFQSHTRTVRSRQAVASNRPSGDHESV